MQMLFHDQLAQKSGMISNVCPLPDAPMDLNFHRFVFSISVGNLNSFTRILIRSIPKVFSNYFLSQWIVLIWNFIVLLKCCTWKNWKKYFSRLEMVFCYHNCSNVLLEKIVLVWGKKLRKKFANSRPKGREFVMFSRFCFPRTRTIFSTVS